MPNITINILLHTRNLNLLSDSRYLYYIYLYIYIIIAHNTPTDCTWHFSESTYTLFFFIWHLGKSGHQDNIWHTVLLKEVVDVGTAEANILQICMDSMAIINFDTRSKSMFFSLFLLLIKKYTCLKEITASHFYLLF